MTFGSRQTENTRGSNDVDAVESFRAARSSFFQSLSLHPKSLMKRLTFPFLRWLRVRVHMHVIDCIYMYFPLLSLSFRTRGELRTLERLRVHKARRIAVALSRGRPCAPSVGGGCRGIAAENEDGKKRGMEENAVAPGATATATAAERVLRGW